MKSIIRSFLILVPALVALSGCSIPADWDNADPLTGPGYPTDLRFQGCSSKYKPITP